jgi:hypothetical protein
MAVLVLEEPAIPFSVSESKACKRILRQRRHVPSQRQKTVTRLQVFTPQKFVFFIATAVRIPNLTRPQEINSSVYKSYPLTELEDWGFYSWQVKKCFCTPQLPDELWGPPSNVVPFPLGVMRPERQDKHSPLLLWPCQE